VHRAQITFDYLDTDSGEVTAGQIRPATRQYCGSGCSASLAGAMCCLRSRGAPGGGSWWKNCCAPVSSRIWLSQPTRPPSAAARSEQKTDRADARLLRELLAQQRLPESWVPPSHVLEVRTLARLYVALMDERRAWQQRIHAQLFHQGVASLRALLIPAGQFGLAAAELSPAGEQMVETAMAAVDAMTEQIRPLRAQLQTLGANQPGVLALTQQYGVGLLCGTIIWAELGDCRRFSNADQAVRFAGLDVTVLSSDGKRSAGRLARQGSPELRWAPFEAAKAAARQTSPDHDYYDAVRERLGGKRPALAVARKLIAAATTPCASSATRPGCLPTRSCHAQPDHP
jgi:transposase